MKRALLLTVALLTCGVCLAENLLTEEQQIALAKYFGFGEMHIYRFDRGLSALQIADVDGDGHNDIAAWNGHKNRIELLYQTTDAKAAQETQPPLDRNELPNRGPFRLDNLPIANRLAWMEFAELTGDEHIDIVYFGEPRELVILPGEPEGGFGPEVSLRASEGEPRGGTLCVGDFNNDQRTDVALLGGELLLIYYQKPGGGLEKPVRLVHSISSIGLILPGDIDGDGRTDLIISEDDEQFGLSVYLQQHDGSFGPLRRIKVPNTRSLTIAPNDNGPDDVFAVEQTTGRLKHYRWQQPELAVGDKDWPARLYSYPVKNDGKQRPMGWGDVDGDGIVDCVAANPDAARLVLFRGSPTGLLPPQAFPGLIKTVDLVLADTNGDGRAEVLSVSSEEKIIGRSRYEDGRLTFPAPLAGDGEPLMVAVGSMQVGQPADRIACLARIRDDNDDEETMITIRGFGDDAPATTIAVEELRDDPRALRFADVNQDGRNDLLLFVAYAPLQLYLQKEDGAFEAFEGPGTRSGLVKQADHVGFDLADVTGDGKPELLLAQESFARALVVRDGRWTVIDQYNTTSPDAQLSGLATLPDRPGSPLITMYDRRGRELLILRRDDDETYKVEHKMPIGNYDPVAMHALPLRPARPVLLLADASKLALFVPSETEATLVEQASYDSEIKDAWLGDSVVGELNGDGIRDVIVVDMRKANLEILTTLSRGSLVRATGFQVFQGKRFSDEPNAGGEPREVRLADVTGDGVDDIVLTVHDRLIVYPAQSKAAE